MNCYISYCFKIENLTDQEMDWLENRLERYSDLACDRDGFELDEIKVDRGKHLVWFNPDEGAYLGHTATFVSKFLKRWRPKEVVTFQWAETCDRDIVDGFGGGACVITAAETFFMSTGDWIAAKLKELGR